MLNSSQSNVKFCFLFFVRHLENPFPIYSQVSDNINLKNFAICGGGGDGAYDLSSPKSEDELLQMNSLQGLQ